jgi:hypothetical protein
VVRNISLNPKTKKYKALKLLAEGKTQMQLVRKHDFNKYVLSRYVKEFLAKKWLKINILHTSPKTYRATPKAPLKPTEGKGQLLHGGVHTRLHHTIWKMDILSEIKREITWDKKVKLRNGVSKLYLFFPTITIEFIPVKCGFGTVVVYPHEKYLDSVETVKHLSIIKEDMRIVRSWLQRVMLCRLSIPLEIQKRHLARPIMNPMVMRVLDRVGRLIIGDVWIDASEKGFEFGELESSDPEKLKTLEMLQWSDMNIPIRVSQLEDEIVDVHKNLKTFNNIMSKEFNNVGGYIQ